MSLAETQKAFEAYSKMLEFGSGVDFDNYEINEDHARIKDASVFRQPVVDSFLIGNQSTSLRLPWNKAVDFRLRPSEVTIHTGYNGHRKSMILGYIQNGIHAQGGQTLTVSLEMPATTTLKRQVLQFVGNDEPSVKVIDDYFSWATGKHWIYDQVGTMKWRRLINICRYAINEKNIKHIFIDSLLKCGIKKTDYDTQCEFVNELTTLTKDTGASIHLVAHSKKPSDIKNNNAGENRAPDKYAISGAAEISDMADNVLIHHKKETETESDFNQFIYVGKQRDPEGDDAEPVYGFRFDNKNLQFKPYPTAPRMEMENWIEGRFV